MRRLARATGFGLSLAVAATVLVGQSAQASPDLAHAKAKAAALRHQMARLQVQQSVAIERYDGIQDQLQQAVSAELNDDDQATNLAAARPERPERRRRPGPRALHERRPARASSPPCCSGSNPGDVLERAQTVRSVIGSDSLTAAADQAVAVQAAGVAKASTVSRVQVAALRQQATASLAQVQLLLARQRTLLAHADRTVVRLAAKEQREAEAKALADAASSGRAAGVPVGSGDSASLPATIEGPNRRGHRSHRRGPLQARHALPVGSDRSQPVRLLRPDAVGLRPGRRHPPAHLAQPSTPGCRTSRSPTSSPATSCSMPPTPPTRAPSTTSRCTSGTVW